MQRQRQTFCGVHRVGNDTIAFRIAFDVVEQKCVTAFSPVMSHLGDRADLHVPVRTVDGFQLADSVDVGNPIAQVTRPRFARRVPFDMLFGNGSHEIPSFVIAGLGTTVSECRNVESLACVSLPFCQAQ